MPPQSPFAAFPIPTCPNGVGTVTAGASGQLFVNANPLRAGSKPPGTLISAAFAMPHYGADSVGVVSPLLSRQQWTKSWTTGSVSLAGGQATATWLGLTPATGR